MTRIRLFAINKYRVIFPQNTADLRLHNWNQLKKRESTLGVCRPEHSEGSQAPKQKIYILKSPLKNPFLPAKRIDCDNDTLF